MKENNLKENLKDILLVPSFFNQEERMISKIKSVLSEIDGLYFYNDRYGNIFVEKGVADIYPLVCAHTDTVHKIEEYSIIEYDTDLGTVLRGVKTNGDLSGCGGDNKTGIFICLELLKTQDVLKVAFFFGEEQGFKGSLLADPKFFKNVGYCLEFDAPDFFWVSHYCSGQQLFDPNGEFWNIARPIMDKHTTGLLDPYLNRHPFTDVLPLKMFYDFSCLNYSSGYMDMHSRSEYVVVNYTIKALETAKELLRALGNTKYHFIKNPANRDAMIYGRDLTHFIKY